MILTKALDVERQMKTSFDLPIDLRLGQANLSFVQLVGAARRGAQAAGKAMRLPAPPTGSVLKVLQRGGFIDALSADDAQFWLHQVVRG